MFRLDVMQNQWLILALVGGAAMVLAFVLCYQASWRQRQRVIEYRNDADSNNWRFSFEHMPWGLMLFYISTLVFEVTYVIWSVLDPPNW